MLICPQCKKNLPLKKGCTRIWECKNCEVTFIMMYGLEPKGREESDYHKSFDFKSGEKL